VIIATWHPHEDTVLDVIRQLGLEYQVIFNKGAVMVLPSGINKAFGLGAALEEMGLSPHNTVAVGDAENDHTLLSLCGCGVAVANALPMLKERADYVTKAERGAGVTELIDHLVSSDLAELGLPTGRLGE
jgi:hydroxymethylpyrimidine pyrophosphatase-like HAD family hydrolase